MTTIQLNGNAAYCNTVLFESIHILSIRSMTVVEYELDKLLSDQVKRAIEDGLKLNSLDAIHRNIYRLLEKSCKTQADVLDDWINKTGS